MSKDKSQNILIVDDRPDNLLVLESILEGPDLNIVKTTSGNDALGLMLEHDFALVLLDVQMPDMDGFETAELMRRAKKTKYVPIIFVTAISKEQKYVFKGYEVGAVDYMFKPLDPDILKSKVNVFLELHGQKMDMLEKKEALKEKNHELALLKNSLEFRIQKRTMDLEKANKELIRLNNVKSDFISMVSHELRTPLTSIKSFAEILLDDIDNIDIELQKRYLSIINEESDRLNRLISSVLDLQKIDAGKMLWKEEKLNLADIARSSVESFCRAYIDKGVLLSLDVIDDPLIVIADSDKIKQVFANLLSNALKFTEKGEVKAVLKQTVSKPTHKKNKAAKMIEVSVSDTGIGIPPEKTVKVFERFCQVDSSQKRKTGGTGLGLAICKEIIEHCQGKIWVESKLGRGSTFIFTLPAAPKK